MTPPARYFLGIDISTTGSKALLINEAGKMVGVQSSPHTLQTPRPLWSEQDPQEWWQAASNSFRKVLAQAGINGSQVAAIGLAGHRWQSGWTRVLDYLVMVPRGMPGLVAGLAFLWVFLFVKPLAPLRTTLFSLWLAYSVVWLAYGMRLVSSALIQVGPELEEAGRTVGASPGQVIRSITLPLIRFGLVGSWVLVFCIFVREYSTGVYLLGPGTEVIGSLIVSLWGGGALDTIAALSVVNILLVALGLGVALRLGVRIHG